MVQLERKRSRRAVIASQENATLRADRAGPFAIRLRAGSSLRNKRLPRMTTKLHHYQHICLVRVSELCGAYRNELAIAARADSMAAALGAPP